MTKPTIPDLDAFVAVARYRSFNRAAAERGVSRSALSHAMRTLEEKLGVRLLNRTTRSVTPTEAGERLLMRLLPALADVETALDEVNTFRTTPIGTLRLNMPRTAVHVLGAIIGPFKVQYPQVKIEIATDDGFVDIVKDGFDAGIRFGESIAGDMIATPIGPTQRFAVVASPDYLERRGAPTSPDDLALHDCICRRYPSGVRFAWEFEKAGRSLEVAVEGSTTLDAEELMLRAAIDGAGIAYLFEHRVADAVASGSLCRLLEDWCPAFPGFFIYYPSRRLVPTALRAFLDFVRSNEGAA